jgi:hypothetical protein
MWHDRKRRHDFLSNFVFRSKAKALLDYLRCARRRHSTAAAAVIMEFEQQSQFLEP